MCPPDLKLEIDECGMCGGDNTSCTAHGKRRRYSYNYLLINLQVYVGTVVAI